MTLLVYMAERRSMWMVIVTQAPSAETLDSFMCKLIVSNEDVAKRDLWISEFNWMWTWKADL